MEALRIEPIARHHVRDQFDCGENSLNHYLSQSARQNDQSNIAKTFVALDTSNTVLGYYSISSASIEFSAITAEIQKGLPRYPIPAARIGRLAVDQSAHGIGLGAHLLIDALERIYKVSNEMGIKFVIVDALNDSAKSFYEHYGFIQFPKQGLKLFLPIETVKVLFT
jgi:GNAT superfamily N-acetyltransferase